MPETTPILETYEQQHDTFQISQTFGTLTDNRQINFSDANQPLAQTVSYHNKLQPMTMQQGAAMAQATLINFIGESGTVSSIMDTVQPLHTQTLTEQSNQLDSNISENLQDMSLPISAHSYTIPHITHSRRTDTDADTTTQQSCNRKKLQSTTILH